MILNNFQLKLQESIITVDLSTTEAYFPLSYRINIELFACEDQTIANFGITNQRVKLLPGSSLTIGDKCLLKSNELIVYSAFMMVQLEMVKIVQLEVVNHILLKKEPY